jgi:ABC-type transporter Mla maintaining outer membrane lipid asymmetry ATPase subunit MlaF
MSEKLVEIRGLRFRRGERVIFDDVDLDFGEATVVLEIDGQPGQLSSDTNARILTEAI